MAGFGYDPDAIYQDADIEQAEFEAEAAVFAARSRRARILAERGQFEDAAHYCPHGGGYPLNSPAATHEGDPNAGEEGFRCSDCGSRLSAPAYEGGEVTAACETRRAA